MPDFYEPWLIMILPAGAFLTLGLLMGGINSYNQRKKRIEKDNIVQEYLKAKGSLKLQQES
jgi:electron transport complex protein RnfE